MQAAPTPTSISKPDTCKFCNMKFTSLNKLFKHLNSGCSGTNQTDEVGKVPADNTFAANEEQSFHRILHVKQEDTNEPERDKTSFWVYLFSAFIILKLFDLPTIFDEALGINYSS